VLKELHLPEIRNSFETVAKEAEQNSLSYEEFLYDLISREHESRRRNRINRFRKESKLNVDKNMENFNLKRFDPKFIQQVRGLLKGDFIQHKENILAFGNPGSGKTHLLSAVCLEMIELGFRPYYITCEVLVQDLLLAKKELKLSKQLKRLDKFHIVLFVNAS
jgi:DNA replication protein DnaC